MMKLFYAFFAVIAACVEAKESILGQCEGYNFSDLEQRVGGVVCGKTKCTLKKGTTSTITMMFTPDTEVLQLTNEVLATMGGVAIPFPGVHGSSACGGVMHAEDGSPAPCPLPPNRHYVYTHSFPILHMYPSVPLRVHWALNNGTKNVLCFEVPAVIVD